MSLRLRLFVSHTIIIVVSLLVLSVALLILLVDYQQRLNIRELSFVAATVVRSLRIAGVTDSVNKVMERVASAGQAQGFQVMLLDSEGIVLRDTGLAAGSLMIGRRIDLARRVAVTSNQRETMATGGYLDAARRRWAFVAIALRPNVAGSNWIAIARPFFDGPIISVQGESLVLPFVEAGGVALLFAAALAALVARSIARPIQKLAQGANAIAQGKYDQRVALSGPGEFKQLADDFNQMATRVQAAQKMERDFVANVSHELKTPLTSIKGFAQAIQDGAVNNPESTQSAARIINEESERLTRLVTTLLDSARLETGEVRMDFRPVAVNDVVRTCLAKLSPRAERNGIVLVNNLVDAPPVQADGDRLSQVFINLLDNALKHTSEGGRVKIENRSIPAEKTQPAGVEYSVSDSGQGIPAEDLPRIFERFYQVDKARAQTDDNGHSGTGLGLAICKQIVEAHHGTISAQSVLGIGTRISVWLPVSQPA